MTITTKIDSKLLSDIVFLALCVVALIALVFTSAYVTETQEALDRLNESREGPTETDITVSFAPAERIAPGNGYAVPESTAVSHFANDLNRSIQ